MSQFLRWSFDPLIWNGRTLLGAPTLGIDECELCILWTLGGGKKDKDEDKFSIYDLGYKKVFYLPRKVNASIGAIEFEQKAGKNEKYEYPFVRKSVLNLEKKGLVKITKDSSGDRMRKTVTLTFSGLSLYLRGSAEEHKVKNALNHHSELIPSADIWKEMCKEIGEKKCTEELERTAVNCAHLLRARFHIKSPSLEFRGYLKSHFYSSLRERRMPLERDTKTSEYLKRKDAATLKDSYLAYLAVHDIQKLSRKDSEQIDRLLPTLDSEREYSYFQNGGQSASLFKGKNLCDLFPKYREVEYFFTGMLKTYYGMRGQVSKKSNTIMRLKSANPSNGTFI